MTYYESIEHFYSDNDSRRSSTEWDCGVHWRDEPDAGDQRVTWVEATGEVYATHGQRIELLGHRSTRPEIDALVEQCRVPNGGLKHSLPSLRSLL